MQKKNDVLHINTVYYIPYIIHIVFIVSEQLYRKCMSKLQFLLILQGFFHALCRVNAYCFFLYTDSITLNTSFPSLPLFDTHTLRRAPAAQESHGEGGNLE